MPAPRAPTVPQFARRLAIETPEHLVLELELAGVGSRIAAAACDAVLLGVLSFGLGLGLAALLTGRESAGAWSTLVAVLALLALFLLFWGYFLLFEALNHGRTPGKRLMGIRVVMDTGHPITFAAAAVRNLIRVVDGLPFGLVGLAFVLFHPQNKRLGDIVAGTVVARDRPEDLQLAGVPTNRQPGAEPLETGPPELSDEEFRLLDQYLERLERLDGTLRRRFTADLAARFAPRFPRRRVRETERPIGRATDRGRGTHHRRGRAVRDPKAGLVGGVSDARGTGGADRLEAAGGGRDSRVRGALSRGGGRSGARPHVRSGPSGARVSRARCERGTQRRLRPAHRPPGPDEPAASARAPSRGGRRARVRGDGPPRVRRSGDHRICPDPGASGDRGTGAHRRDAGTCAGGGRAPRAGHRLRAGAFDVSALHRLAHHHEQRATGVPGVRLRDHRRHRHAAAARVQRAVLRCGARAVRELRTGRVAAHVRRRPWGARADRDLHRRRRRATRGPGPARPRRPDPARRAGARGSPGGPSGGSLRPAARARGYDRRAAVRERRPRSLQVRDQRGDGRPADPLPRERAALPQLTSHRTAGAAGGQRSQRQRPALSRRGDHHRAGGENRGRWRRLTASASPIHRSTDLPVYRSRASRMPRILRDSASICFRPATVSPSYLSAPRRSSWVSARMAARGLERSCRSLRIGSAASAI